MKALLVAACADNVSMGEIHSYLHDARPLLKTNKDRVTFDKLQRAVTLLMDYQQHEDGALGRLKALMEDTRPGNENGECSGRFWRIINRHVPGADEAYKEMEECQKRRRESEDAEDKLAKDELQDGKRLYNEVRDTLGLPPLKE